MKRLIIWLAILLPFIANAQVNGTIQKTASSGVVRGNFGSSGADTIVTVRGVSVNGQLLQYNSTYKKWIPYTPSAIGSTGIISGGTMTGIGSADVIVSSGKGTILNNTDPDNPTFSNINWVTDTISLTDNAVNYIKVTSSATITASTTPPTASEYRTSIILGFVRKASGVITAINGDYVPVQQTPANMNDLSKAIGLTKDGLAISPASTNLKIQVSSGKISGLGINFSNNVLDPNNVNFTANNPQTFRMATSAGTSVTDVTDLPVGFYNPSGSTISAIGGGANESTIFTVYKFPTTGNVRILYGNTLYSNLAAAVTGIGTYVPSPPAAYRDAIIIGYIAAVKNATNLSNTAQAVFVTTNKFGLAGMALATSALTNYVPISRLINSGYGLTGGGDLSNDRTLAVDTTAIQTVANFFPKGDTRYAKLSSGFVNSITGTANQVIASSSTGAVTLSLPQSIGTSSTPRFGSLSLGVAPPVWGSFTNMFDMLGGSIGGTSSTDFRLFSNLYYDGAAYKLRNNGTGSILDLSSGAINYFNTSSGSAGDTKTLSNRFAVSNVGDITASKLNLNYSSGIPLNIQDGTGLGVYLSANNTLNFNYGVNSESSGYINFQGYNGGTSQFRNLIISDGKQGTIATFTGSSKALTLASLAGTGTRMVVADPSGVVSTQAIPGGGGGAVTGVAVATANGLAGTSDGATVVPTLTLSTTVNAPILAGNGAAISAATTTGSGSTAVLSNAPSLTGTVNSAGTINTNAENAISAASAGSDRRFGSWANTSGGILWGIENSSGGSLITGAPAYSTVLGNVVNKPVIIGTNNTVRLTIDAASVFSGTLSASNLSGTNTGDQNLAPYALLNSPTFTGTPTLPTGTIAVTQTQGDNSTKIATTAYVDGSLTSKTNRMLKDWYTDANNVTTSETDLYDYTVPSNTLVNNGDKLYFEIGGSYSGTANTKEIKLTFGSTGFIFGSTTSAGGNWTVKGFLVKTGATSYRIVASNTDDAPDKISTYSSTGSVTNYTGTNIFKISATGGASADITAKSGYLEFKPAAP